jgi:hypothetical protein
MENENIYSKIQEFFGGLNQNFSLMEDPVDVNVQMHYFETSFRMRDNVNEADIFARKDELFDPNITIENKKALLVQMANVPNPEIYRVLESYAKNPDKELIDWAKMALQENKLLLESHLLDDNRQVFISTGLGGKGHKLRYFVVLINKEGYDLKPFQQKVIKDEMDYALQRYNGELEHLIFMNRYSTMRMVLPISSDITRMLRDGINECNQFGDFLSPDFIVTNLKEMSEEEINEALSVYHPITGDDFPPVE